MVVIDRAIDATPGSRVVLSALGRQLRRAEQVRRQEGRAGADLRELARRARRPRRRRERGARAHRLLEQGRITSWVVERRAWHRPGPLGHHDVGCSLATSWDRRRESTQADVVRPQPPADVVEQHGLAGPSQGGAQCGRGPLGHAVAEQQDAQRGRRRSRRARMQGDHLLVGEAPRAGDRRGCCDLGGGEVDGGHRPRGHRRQRAHDEARATRPAATGTVATCRHAGARQARTGPLDDVEARRSRGEGDRQAGGRRGRARTDRCAGRLMNTSTGQCQR